MRELRQLPGPLNPVSKEGMTWGRAVTSEAAREEIFVGHHTEWTGAA